MSKRWLRLLILAACIDMSSTVVGAAPQEDKLASGGSSQSPQTQGKRVTGQLTHIEGCITPSWNPVEKKSVLASHRRRKIHTRSRKGTISLP